MTDMNDWTEDEKASYLKNVQRLEAHGEMLCDSEVGKLSDNVKYALMELYRDVIGYERPQGKLQIVKGWFKRLLRPDNAEEMN